MVDVQAGVEISLEVAEDSRDLVRSGSFSHESLPGSLPVVRFPLRLDQVLGGRPTLERTIRLSCLHHTKNGDCVWSLIQEVAGRLPPLVHLASGSYPRRTTLRSTYVVRLDPRSSSQEPFRSDPAHVGRAS